jgi:hypothetical protein
VNKLVIAFAVLAACSSQDTPDSPEVAAAKVECKQVLQHLVEISPRGKDADAAQVVAKLPVEDIEACVAAEPEARACMGKAADVEAVRKCIPSGAAIDCMQRAKKHPDVRAKCYAGDVHAADGLDDQ